MVTDTGGAPSESRRVARDPSDDRVQIILAGEFMPSGSRDEGRGGRLCQRSTTP